jgi:hypothetical protein
MLEGQRINDSFIVEVNKDPESMSRAEFKAIQKEYNLYPDPEEGVDLLFSIVSGSGAAALTALMGAAKIESEVNVENKKILCLMYALQAGSDRRDNFFQDEQGKADMDMGDEEVNFDKWKVVADNCKTTVD